MKTLTHSILLLLPFIATACGGGAGDAGGVDAPTAGLPERFWLEAAPANVPDVGAARADLADGATVTVRGVIGGSTKPFVEGLAAFTIVDPALESCVGHDMGCETPWDYCCVDPQAIADNSATVEFREGGRVLEAGLRGAQGLDPLTTIVVQGVAELDSRGNVTIVASGVRALD